MLGPPPEHPPHAARSSRAAGTGAAARSRGRARRCESGCSCARRPLRGRDTGTPRTRHRAASRARPSAPSRSVLPSRERRRRRTDRCSAPRRHRPRRPHRRSRRTGRTPGSCREWCSVRPCRTAVSFCRMQASPKPSFEAGDSHDHQRGHEPKSPHRIEEERWLPPSRPRQRPAECSDPCRRRSGRWRC